MKNFITEIIDNDIKNGLKEIKTRFPPEPNGYLHLGHAKSMYLNFGIAKQYNGMCNLRLDDTNPSAENKDYVEAIIKDMKWLGFEPAYISYASDNFYLIYGYAEFLIKAGKAYVCDLTADEVSNYRSGSSNTAEPDKPSPYRNRTVEENLILFQNMRDGKYNYGAKTLRAKIDLASPNLNMRDPIIYRIDFTKHHRTGDTWVIYPTYDFAHPLCDAIEGITHSICTLEFEDHRPLYDWVVNSCRSDLDKPKQIEFARLNVENVILSKRKLADVVRNHINNWDDARLPTLSGLRNRGYSPDVIKAFCEEIGIAKNNSLVNYCLLENALRAELNKTARRAIAIFDPIYISLDEGFDKIRPIEIENNPEDPNAGTRTLLFPQNLIIESEDFMEVPEAKFYRLSPGKEVRLKGAGIIKYLRHWKEYSDLDPSRVIGIYLSCAIDYDVTRKVKSTLFWLPDEDGLSNSINVKWQPALVNEYAHLFNKDGSYNVNSKTSKTICVENATFKIGERVQFVRKGYYVVESLNPLTFGSILPLRDSK